MTTSTSTDYLAQLRETGNTEACRLCDRRFHPAEIPDLPTLIIGECGDSSAAVCIDCAIESMRFNYELAQEINTDYIATLTKEWKRAMPLRTRRINAAFKAAGINAKMSRRRRN